MSYHGFAVIENIYDINQKVIGQNVTKRYMYKSKEVLAIHSFLHNSFYNYSNTRNSARSGSYVICGEQIIINAEGFSGILGFFCKRKIIIKKSENALQTYYHYLDNDNNYILYLVGEYRFIH